MNRCANCKAKLTKKSGNKTCKYCSPACREAKRCKGCGKPIGPGYPNRQYCSVQCRNWGAAKNCDTCGKSFHPANRHTEWKNTRWSGRFCTRHCASIWASKHKECCLTVTRHCEHCGVLMVGVHAQRRFCSQYCQTIPKAIPCDYCGQIFISTQQSPKKPRVRYCSNRCRKAGSGHVNSIRQFNPTPEEIAVQRLFPASRLRHRIYTGRKTLRGANHWYELDICFPEIKLDVEIDGGIHLIHQTKDQIRTMTLKELGWTVLRFSNHQVIQDLKEVEAVISSTISLLMATQAIPSVM